MNSSPTVLLIAALALLGCNNTAPLPLKANVTSVLDSEGKELIRYEIESEPGTLVSFKTRLEKDKLTEKEGVIEPNGRWVIVAPVWKGDDFKRQVGIQARKTEKGILGPYSRSGYLDISVSRKPRLLDGRCVVDGHKCETEVAVDTITVKGVEVGTIVAVGDRQEKVTSDSVQIPIDVAPKVPTGLMPDSDGTKAYDIPKFPIIITFPDGAQIQDEVLFPLSKLHKALTGLEPGRALRFGGESATGGAKGLLFINNDLKMMVIGSAATVAELDLVAKETTIATEVDCGRYVGTFLAEARGKGTTYTHKVSVWERRTGKDIANREFKPKGSPCRDEVFLPSHDKSHKVIDAGSLKESQRVIDEWLNSLLSR